MSGKTNDFADAMSRYPAADVNPLSTEDVTESMIATVMSKELGEITSKKNDCPLYDKCNTQNVVYKATTQNPDPHFKLGVTENFKTRWYHHKQTFKNPVLKNSTALSSLTWGRNLGGGAKYQVGNNRQSPTLQTRSKRLPTMSHRKNPHTKELQKE